MTPMFLLKCDPPSPMQEIELNAEFFVGKK